MKPDELGVYNAFLQTGKVEDYLRYVDVKQTARDAVQTGENSAHYDRCDRASDARG